MQISFSEISAHFQNKYYTVLYSFVCIILSVIIIITVVCRLFFWTVVPLACRGVRWRVGGRKEGKKKPKK